MSKGYVIARAAVANADAWSEDAARASPAIKKYGGRPRVRGGRFEVAAGEGRAHNGVIESDSFEAARASTFSPEYAAAARKLRENAGVIDIVVVEGV